MASLKLTYLDIADRGEPIRLALAVAGIEFEDERISGAEFGAIKPKLPLGCVPVLSVDDVVYAQSSAILRYVGKRGGLYPRDDDLPAMRVDEVVDMIEEVSEKLYIGSSAAARKKLVDGVVPRYLSRLNEIAEENERSPWLVGSSMTVADLKCYVFVSALTSGWYEHVPADVVNKYTYVLQACKAVSEQDRVAEWEKAHLLKA